MTVPINRSRDEASARRSRGDRGAAGAGCVGPSCWPCPQGNAHWGQLICERCRKALRWLPEPRRPSELPTEVPDEGPDGPTPLVGTPGQVAWATRIRDRMKDRLDRIRSARWLIIPRDAFSRRRRPTQAEVAAGPDPVLPSADSAAAPSG